MSTLNRKERAEALFNFLSEAHAEEYCGLDDDMIDDCNRWIAGLSDDEICELVLETFHEGI